MRLRNNEALIYAIQAHPPVFFTIGEQEIGCCRKWQRQENSRADHGGAMPREIAGQFPLKRRESPSTRR